MAQNFEQMEQSRPKNMPAEAAAVDTRGIHSGQG